MPEAECWYLGHLRRQRGGGSPFPKGGRQSGEGNVVELTSELTDQSIRRFPAVIQPGCGFLSRAPGATLLRFFRSGFLFISYHRQVQVEVVATVRDAHLYELF